MNCRCAYLAVTLLLLILPVAIRADEVVLSPDREGVSLGLHLEIFEDPTALKFITEVTQPPVSARFTRSVQEKPNFGYTASAYWATFTLRNEHPRQDEFLLVIPSLLDHIALYAEDGRGSWQVRQTGRHETLGERDVVHRFPTFIMQIPKGEARTFYIRVASQGGMQFPMTVWTQRGFAANDHEEQLVNGAYFGIMLVMALYNLFLFFSVADRSYLYYVLYILGFAGFQLGWSGFLHEYLWPVQPYFANISIPFFIGTAVLFGALFGRSFLGTREHSPRLDQAYRLLAIAGGGVVVLTFTASYLTTVRAAIVTGMALSLALMGGALFRWRQGFHPARLFLLAWTALIVGVLIVGLRNFNVFPINFVTSYSHQLGSVLEVILLSLALADRINQMKREKELADAQALEKQRRMTESFARFVPEQFLRFLNKKEVEDVQLGDAVGKEMTILFIDIRSFTTISERMTPEETFRFINDYLNRVGPIIRDHNGFIDKFIGDAIMALFPQSPADAVAAAVAIRRRLATYNAERRAEGAVEVRIGAGIHTGALMLGTIGEEKRLETTVIADAVNLASRLEGITKLYGAGIIVSEASLARMGDGFHTRILDTVRVKGKNDTVSVFEVFDGDPPEVFERKLATRHTFEAAIGAYRAGNLDAAERQFMTLAAQAPGDEVVQMYIRRCGEYRLQGASPDAESLEKF